MHQISFRLKPGQLLKEEIEKIAVDKKISSGVIISIVGGLEKAVLRMANATPNDLPVKVWDEATEIVSGTGTISDSGCHIHISISDRDGQVFGGHLKDGCIIKFTAEIVILVFEDVKFKRKFDNETGFEELEIEQS